MKETHGVKLPLMKISSINRLVCLCGGATHAKPHSKVDRVCLADIQMQHLKLRRHQRKFLHLLNVKWRLLSLHHVLFVFISVVVGRCARQVDYLADDLEETEVEHFGVLWIFPVKELNRKNPVTVISEYIKHLRLR